MQEKTLYTALGGQGLVGRAWRAHRENPANQQWAPVTGSPFPSPSMAWQLDPALEKHAALGVLSLPSELIYRKPQQKWAANQQADLYLEMGQPLLRIIHAHCQVEGV